MADYDSITFHTAACDDHFYRLLNVHGPEGLDDVCPLCEIERLTAELELKRGVINDLAEEHSALKMHYSKLQAELKQANAVVEAARNLQSNSTLDNVFARDEKLRQALAALETDDE